MYKNFYYRFTALDFLIHYINAHVDPLMSTIKNILGRLETENV